MSFDLPLPKIDTLDGFVLDTFKYERLIAEQNGNLDLGCIKPYSLSELDLMHYSSICSTYEQNVDVRTFQSLVEQSEHWEPAAKMTNREGFIDDMMNTYQVMYANYVVAKNLDFHWMDHGIKYEFPNTFCWPSTTAIVGQLWLSGKHNASMAYNTKSGHVFGISAYVVDGEDYVLGFDPTSDQLGEYEGKIRRNAVFVKKGTQWSYKAKWGHGVEMFPDRIMHFGMLKDMLRRDGHIYGPMDKWYKGGKKFMEESFANV